MQQQPAAAAASVDGEVTNDASVSRSSSPDSDDVEQLGSSSTPCSECSLEDASADDNVLDHPTTSVGYHVYRPIRLSRGVREVQNLGGPLFHLFSPFYLQFPFLRDLNFDGRLERRGTLCKKSIIQVTFQFPAVNIKFKQWTVKKLLHYSPVCENARVVFCRYFYRAMHYNAKRGLVIACRLSVCL